MSDSVFRVFGCLLINLGFVIVDGNQLRSYMAGFFVTVGIGAIMPISRR